MPNIQSARKFQSVYIFTIFRCGVIMCRRTNKQMEKHIAMAFKGFTLLKLTYCSSRHPRHPDAHHPYLLPIKPTSGASARRKSGRPCCTTRRPTERSPPPKRDVWKPRQKQTETKRIFQKITLSKSPEHFTPGNPDPMTNEVNLRRYAQRASFVHGT